MGTAVNASSGNAKVDGLRIAYEVFGTGSPPVVLVHGAFGDHTYFAPEIEHLSRRHRVVALDLRGHGRSDPQRSVSLRDFAADVTGVCDASGIRGAVVCGHSAMGQVALMVAATRPDLVSAVVMLDSPVLFPSDLLQQRAGFVAALASDGWLEALRGYFARTMDAQDPPDLRARVMADLGRTRAEFARSFFADLFASDYADVVRDSRCPLLYVRAKAPVDLGRLRQLRPDAMVGQVVGSGHYLTLAVPAQVNAMLDRFLEIAEEGPDLQ